MENLLIFDVRPGPKALPNTLPFVSPDYFTVVVLPFITFSFPKWKSRQLSLFNLFFCIESGLPTLVVTLEAFDILLDNSIWTG